MSASDPDKVPVGGYQNPDIPPWDVLLQDDLDNDMPRPPALDPPMKPKTKERT